MPESDDTDESAVAIRRQPWLVLLAWISTCLGLLLLWSPAESTTLFVAGLAVLAVAAPIVGTWLIRKRPDSSPSWFSILTSMVSWMGAAWAWFIITGMVWLRTFQGTGQID